MRAFAFRLALVLLAAFASPLYAQNSIERGDLVVYYNAIPSTTLTPDVARQYSVTRSAGRALLNISVLRKQADGNQKAITAKVTASATNLNGQRQDLTMREVREGEAIYYLAEPRLDGKETLNFEFSVLVEGSAEPMTGRFAQEFFAAES